MNETSLLPDDEPDSMPSERTMRAQERDRSESAWATSTTSTLAANATPRGPRT